MKLGITISIKANQQTRMALIKMHRELKAMEAEVTVVIIEEDEQQKPVFVVVDGHVDHATIEHFRHIASKMHEADGIIAVARKEFGSVKKYEPLPLQISELKTAVEHKIHISKQIKQDYKHRQKFHKGKL